ncbi:MAG TPA: TrkH family potassium uptake protein [Caldisericia bacterium]|mgnify:FL=1|nr:TrkH family potassium uptake protein [Caldisericia bacterium]HQJ43602.1 TrkH family potassium uptake protein [Caldisericia bacterium]
MLRKLTIFDLKVILYYTGKIIFGLALTMIIPLAIALIYKEFDSALDFALGMSVSIIFGLVCMRLMKTNKSPNLFQSMTIAALTWIFACLFSSIPFYLSGHFQSYLDVLFDLMSGFTTTGYSLIQDLDHVSNALNMWRHLIHYIGGQGIVVMALSFLIKNSGGAFQLMVGEAKDEPLEPSITKTAQNIWIISLVCLFMGTAMAAIAAYYDGLAWDRSILHGSWMFMSAWSTGGFGPCTQNLLFYHSYAFEIILCIFMMMGSINFSLHYIVWKGKPKELLKDIEIKSLVVTLSITTMLVAWGLSSTGIFTNLNAVLRRGIVLVVSGHTGTGQMTVYAKQLVHSWHPLAYMGICIAMMLGGSAASTAGSFKALRIGIFFKGLIHETKRLILPESAVFKMTFHHIKDQIIESGMVKMAGLIILCYCFIYLFGAVVGVACGYPLSQATFESISAGANVGLTMGVVSPSMPAILKITYIITMWLGRLEFLSIFVLIGSVGLAIGQAFKGGRK